MPSHNMIIMQSGVTMASELTPWECREGVGERVQENFARLKRRKELQGQKEEFLPGSETVTAMLLESPGSVTA